MEKLQYRARVNIILLRNVGTLLSATFTSQKIEFLTISAVINFELTNDLSFPYYITDLCMNSECGP